MHQGIDNEVSLTVETGNYSYLMTQLNFVYAIIQVIAFQASYTNSFASKHVA